jgi:hypothetical protein
MKHGSKRQSSARSLGALSALLIPMGIAVISPEAGVLFLVLSGGLALLGAVLGAKRIRIICLILLVISLSLAAWRFTDARHMYGKYQKRAIEKSQEVEKQKR